MLDAEPVINEFLASNNGEIQDEDGDFSDFIELTNRGDQAVNLAGWYLTDNASDLNKWQFPSINLSPGQYLVVFASVRIAPLRAASCTRTSRRWLPRASTWRWYSPMETPSSAHLIPSSRHSMRISPRQLGE